MKTPKLLQKAVDWDIFLDISTKRLSQFIICTLVDTA